MAAIKLMSDKDLQKKYGSASVVAKDITIENKRALRIPSRVIWLNAQTGGGLVYGKVHEIFGYESTGKSLIAKDFGYVTQSLGGVVLWDDAEQAFDYAWAVKNGLDLDKLYVYDGNDIEGVSDWARDMSLYHRSKLVNNEPILLVIDSLAALETLEEIDGDQKNVKGSYGMGKAKKINEFYRKRIGFFKKYGITVIIVNQIRKKINATMYENAEITPGGDATKFFASMRIALAASTMLKGSIVKGVFKEDKMKGMKVGRRIFLDVIKNKTYPLMPRVKTTVYFRDMVVDYVGYDRYNGLPEIFVRLKIVKKKGSRYYRKGTLICNGEDKFIRLLHDDDKLRKLLVSKANINTISKTRKLLETMDENLYPMPKASKKSKDEEEE